MYVLNHSHHSGKREVGSRLKTYSDTSDCWWAKSLVGCGRIGRINKEKPSFSRTILRLGIRIKKLPYISSIQVECL